MNKIIEVDKINKKFNKKQVLEDVSFSVSEGQILGFIGPNGAGKTTTIKLMLGLQSIDSGNVKINGYDLKENFEKAIAKVGAIVESPDLYMYMTGRKNLELIASLYGIKDKKKIDNAIKLVGLEKRIDDKVSKYSLGMRQRLGIAAALINEPNVLILDEPTNGLDPEGIKELRNLLKKLAKEQKMSIIISSHNLSELESFITDVCLIQNGKIIAIMPIEEIKKSSSSSYLIELDKTNGLEKIVKYKYEIIDKNTIRCYISKKEITDLILILINSNYKVYGLKFYTLTLEEAFLNKTGGNVID